MQPSLNIGWWIKHWAWPPGPYAHGLSADRYLPILMSKEPIPPKRFWGFLLSQHPGDQSVNSPLSKAVAKAKYAETDKHYLSCGHVRVFSIPTLVHCNEPWPALLILRPSFQTTKTRLFCRGKFGSHVSYDTSERFGRLSFYIGSLTVCSPETRRGQSNKLWLSSKKWV